MAVPISKIVDFAPEYSITGDFKKISEYDFLLLNSIILPVVAVCCMEKGSNQLYPEMGAKDYFMSLPYSERNEVSDILTDISAQISRYTNATCEVSVDESNTDWPTGNLVISLDISGVPNPIKMQVGKSSTIKPFKTVGPDVFRK